jgi:ribonuclease T2
LLLVLLCLGGTAAHARHHQYREADETQGAQGIPGQFDYYLLSLSWSPTYCLTHPYDRAQCAGKGYGFVLHGLWPQYESGGYPQDCAATPLDPQAAAIGNSLYPSPKLAAHEWARHGGCSGMDAVSYFRAADRATAAIRIPSMLEAPASVGQMSAEQIGAAFQTANPTLPAHALTVACSHGRLMEVRVCLTRELTVRPCGRGVRSSCPAPPVQIR